MPQEYWSLDVTLDRIAPLTGRFQATTTGRAKEKELANEEQVNAILEDIKTNPFVVTGIRRTEKKRQPCPLPPPPSQQEGRKLNMTPRRTMSIAQQLYEGIDIAGEGAVGLITYMRTDSLRLSDDALEAAKTYIVNHMARNFIRRPPAPSRPRPALRTPTRPSVPRM